MRHIIIVLAILFALLSSGALGQAPAPNAPILSGHFLIDNWTSAQGLPQNTIPSICQTPDGYLWLASQNGLIRFDGRSFVQFNHSNTPSIEQDWITNLVLSPNGTLWFGTFGGGIVSYREGVFRSYSTKDGLADNNVMVLFVMSDDEIWIGTRGAGISVLRNGSFSKIDTASGLPGNSILAIHRDRNGVVWIGTTNGLAVRDKNGTRIFRKANGLPDSAVEVVHESDDGTIFVGTRSGLVKYHGGTFVPACRPDLPPHRYVTVHTSSAGEVWVGGYVAGVRRIVDGRAEEVTLRPNESPTVLAIFRDLEGSLWVGTDAFGLFRIRNARVRSLTAPKPLSTASIWSVCESSDGSIWVGSDGKGIDRLSGKKRTSLRRTDGLPSDVIFSLCKGPDQSIWIGTDKGLARSTNGRIRTYTQKDGYPFSSTSVIYPDRNGAVWVAENGTTIGRYDGKNWSYISVRDGLPKMIVTSLLLDRTNTLWIGSVDNKGVTAYKSGRATQYTTQNGLSVDAVLCLFEDSLGGVWAGTFGGGLNRFYGDRWTSITTARGLAEDVVSSIERDAIGMIWLSGNAGLFRVSERELIECALDSMRSIHGLALTQADGMPSEECCGGMQPAVLKSHDGRLWYPTIAGLAVVDPKTITVNQVPPPVIVQHVRAERKPLSLQTRLDLGPGIRDMEFDYAGLSFITPDRMKFRYQLEGYDREWIDVGNRRQAFYTGLVPGEYAFRVQAANADGVWNETGALLSITLRPMWYQRWWFYGLVIGAVGAIAYALHRFRIRTLVHREKELKARVDEALASIRILGGLIPICAKCKKIRDDKGYWNNLELYIRDHSEAVFSHSICPDCAEVLYGEYFERDEKTGKLVPRKKP